MNIAFASSEVYPFAKTGGLGDVVGALPKVLHELGHDVKVFLPNYDHISHQRYFINYCHDIGEISVRVAGRVHGVHLHMAYLPGSEVPVYFIDCPYFFHRGMIYTNSLDEDERFILFSKAVLETIQRLQWKPDIIHCNDWQTGLIPLYIKDNYSWDKLFMDTATVMTIHNIGYQGRFPETTVGKAEIRKELFYDNSPIEVWGRHISFLKTGIMFADVVNTVSKTYAGEITTSEYGAGLEGSLIYRINDFYGILNGVDYAIWNPETDPLIPFHYSMHDLTGKQENKKFLASRSGLDYDPEIPLIGIVSRLVDQKGFNIFADAIPELMKINARWAILGSGENRYEELFRGLAAAMPGKVAAHIGYDDQLAHQIEAGADIFLMPSKYEPCGLNQIYSLKYGTVPVVRKTGGLADTVWDWHENNHYGYDTGTGFSFHDYTAGALTSTVQRAVAAYYDKPLWYKIMVNGMTKDYSWESSAKQYEGMYQTALYNRRSR